MFFTARKPYLSKHAREIAVSKNSNLPQLFRLCSQYDFAVIGINERSATPKQYRLIHIKRDFSEQSPIDITDNFDSLTALEQYAHDNLVDIIQHHFGASAKPSSGYSGVA